MEAAHDIVLSEEEVRLLTGLKPAAHQLKRLHAMGFYRAWKSKTTGRIILERAHYEAVSAGHNARQATNRPRPQLRIVTA